MALSGRAAPIGRWDRPIDVRRRGGTVRPGLSRPDAVATLGFGRRGHRSASWPGTRAAVLLDPDPWRPPLVMSPVRAADVAQSAAAQGPAASSEAPATLSHSPAGDGRRRWLVRAASLVSTVIAPPMLLVPRYGVAHVGAGPVEPPLPVPLLDIRWQDGRRSTLAARLQGRISAVQTMFTACSATCPLQGALFAMVQGLLDGERGQGEGGEGGEGGEALQLLSLSIDPMTDEPAELTTWLAAFGAGSRWQAGAPALDQVDSLFDFLRARSDRLDRHTGQVYLFNRRGELVLRTVDLPQPEQVVMLMRRLAARAERS